MSATNVEARGRCSRLGPAGAGGNTVRLGARGRAVSLTRRSLLHMQGVRKRSLAHAAQGLASSGLLVLLVGGGVERDEEDQVGAQSSDTSKGSKLLAGAATSVGHPGPVCRGEVRVRRKVYEACPDVRQSPISSLCGRHKYVPRSMINWIIWRRVTHSFHQMRMPRALWK